jgi:VWFA-related protein
LPWRRWLGAVSACIALSLPSLHSAPLQAPTEQPDQPRSKQSPQLIPRTHEERELRYETAHRIILNVRVFDNAAKPFTKLTESDFTLLDDHQPRKILSFRSVQHSATIAPVHIILILDTVNNSSKKLAFFRKEIERFLKQGEDPLSNPTSIGVFTESGISLGHPSQNRRALLAELATIAGSLHTTGCTDNSDQAETLRVPGGIGGEGIRGKSIGALSCLNQRFTLSVSALDRLALQEVSDPQRVILIWMGLGWPLLTNREFREDTSELRKNFFEKLVEVSVALREAQITLDAISSPDLSLSQEARDTHDTGFFNGAPNESMVHAGNLGLHALAHQTGGQILTYSKDIPSAIAACVADAESYYVLAFDSPPAATFGEYHSLEVKVDKPDLTVRTSTLYYAEQ